MGRSKSQRKNQAAKKFPYAHRAQSACDFPLNLNQGLLSLNKTQPGKHNVKLSLEFSGAIATGDELTPDTYADWKRAVPDLTPGLYAQFVQSVSPGARRRVRVDGVAAMREEIEWFARQRAPQPAEADAPADFGVLPPDLALPLAWQNNFNADFLQDAGGQGVGAGYGAAVAQPQDFQMPPVNPAYLPNTFVDQQAFQAPMAAPQNFGLYPQAQNPMSFNGVGAPLLPAEQPLYQGEFPPELFSDAFVNQSLREYTRASVDGQTGGAQQLAPGGQYQENMKAQPVLGHHSNSPFSDAAMWTSGRASPSVDQSVMAVSTPSHNGSVPSIVMSSSSFQQEYVPPVRDNHHQAWDNFFDESMLANPQRFLSPACDPVPGPSRIPFDQKVNSWMGEIPMSTCSGPVTPPARTEESSSSSSSFSVGSSGDTSTDFESSINDNLSSRGTSPTSTEEVAYGLFSGMSEADVSFKSPSPLPTREDASAIGSYRSMDEDSQGGMSPAAFSIRETGLEKDLNPEVFAAIENDRTPSPCPPSPEYQSFTPDSFFF